MGTSKTQWWDKDGNVHDGYIINGNTYTDEAGKTRVPTGSTVKTNGGMYNMTDSGGVPTMATARNQYDQKSNAAINAYQAAGNIQKERIESATNAAVAELNRQKELTKTNRIDADKAAKEAYRAAANPFGALEEQRVRLGLDESGYAESSKLRLASDYAAQLNSNLRAMNEQLQALDVQIAQAKAEGKYQLANMLEARAQNIMQQQMSLQSNLYSGDMQAISQAENTRQYNEQMAYNREQDAIANARYEEETAYARNLEKAQTLAAIGDFSGFRALGYTDEQINTMKNVWNAQRQAQATAVRSSGGGNGGSGKTAEAVDMDYVKDLYSMIKKDDYAVSDWIKEYGSSSKLTADEISALYALEAAEGTGNGGKANPQIATAARSLTHPIGVAGAWVIANTIRTATEGDEETKREAVFSYLDKQNLSEGEKTAIIQKIYGQS